MATAITLHIGRVRLGGEPAGQTPAHMAYTLLGGLTPRGGFVMLTVNPPVV